MSINSIEEYLNKLRTELKGSDPATIQDALSDAEDHLFSALENVYAENSAIEMEDAIGPIIDAYGSPAETANAYREIDSRILPGLANTEKNSSKAKPLKFFEIFSNPNAWGALFYLLISLPTGIIYFTWLVIGLSLSLSLSLFIFGLPLAVFFLLSFRGLALVEGRIVEALLGERMPRRPLFSNPDLPWQKRLKQGLLDRQNWSTIVYLFLQLPLGVLNFTIFTTLIALSLSLMAMPIVQGIFQIPLFDIPGTNFFIQEKWFPLVVVSGFLLLTATMHIAKWIGKLHANLAKNMLVSN